MDLEHRNCVHCKVDTAIWFSIYPAAGCWALMELHANTQGRKLLELLMLPVLLTMCAITLFDDNADQTSRSRSPSARTSQSPLVGIAQDAHGLLF